MYGKRLRTYKKTGFSVWTGDLQEKQVVHAIFDSGNYTEKFEQDLVEAEKFNIRFPDPSEITETADKLRWYRYRKALLQREVAEYAGIDRSTYIHYEEYGRDYYPLDKMEKIAEILGVPVTELLDEYNRFL